MKEPYLLSLLGLETSNHEAEKLARGLKDLRMGDILAILGRSTGKKEVLNKCKSKSKG